MNWLKKILEFLFRRVKPFNPFAEGYRPVFAEHFINPIDWNKWDWREPWSGDADTHKEVTWWRKECVEQKPDGIHLIAKRDGDKNACGLISTHKFFTYKYGYTSIIAKVPPDGFTYFSAGWGYDPTGHRPEVDIFEFAGVKSNQIWWTHHFWNNQGGAEARGISKLFKTDFSQDFHTYSTEWTPTKLRWLVDGIEYYSVTEYIPQVPIFLMVNIQSGGSEGAFKHLFTPEESGKSLIVKSIEIFQK